MSEAAFAMLSAACIISINLFSFFVGSDRDTTVKMADDEIAVFIFFSKADSMSSGCLFQIQRMAHCPAIDPIHSGHTGQVAEFI